MPEPTASRPITLADLMNSRSSDDPDDHGKFATISVTRAMNKTIYSVPKDGGDNRATACAGARSRRAEGAIRANGDLPET